MTEILDAIVAGFLLVMLSMIAGGIIYVVVKDLIKRNIHRKD